MKDIIETNDLLLQFQEQTHLHTFEDVALAVLAVRQLTQVTDDLRRKIKLHKADMSLEEIVELSKLIRESGILSNNALEVKRYTGGKVSWDRDIR